MPNKKRTESDSLGFKKIESNKLWGAQTQRSLENFKIGNDKIPIEIIIVIVVTIIRCGKQVFVLKVLDFFFYAFICVSIWFKLSWQAALG